MADETQSRRDNALDFLDELDRRHDFLLTELDQLSIRIDAVLGEYAKSRQSGGVLVGTGSGANEPTLASTTENASNSATTDVDFE